MPAPRVGGPKPPIFHLLRLRVGVEGNANFSVRVGGNANFSVFRYLHVGIPNAELWHWGSKTTRGPNANGFALQWNIGFIVILSFLPDSKNCVPCTKIHQILIFSPKYPFD